MKTITFLLILLLSLQSCNKISEYEAEEMKALEEISNDYLVKEDLSKIINLPDSMFGGKVYKPNLDSLDIKVYLSDALLPIAQEKEDNSWMFMDNDFSKSDSIIFYKIVNSKKFKELGYKEFDKKQIILKKPYSQSSYSEIKKHADKPYKILKFSRICFDEKMENGIVVVEILDGLEYGTMSGFNGAILIRKKNNHWEYIQKP
jgi:hypothetical protein